MSLKAWHLKFLLGTYLAMTKIIPVILSGGSGSRLWPVSRLKHPKPFIEVSGKPLLVHALERAANIGDEVVIVTNAEHFDYTKKLVSDSKVDLKVSYLLEPVGKNTAPAIALAVQYIIKKYSKDKICMILPADHMIINNKAFKEDVFEASRIAQSGNLVIFGVQPTSPDTGYGYIQVDKKEGLFHEVLSFIEKPDYETALKYVVEGCYYWNTGMFCFTAETLSVLMSNFAPEIWNSSSKIIDSVKKDKNIYRFDKNTFSNLPNISFDYAVLEKTSRVNMVIANFGWSDIGNWDAMAQVNEKCSAGNSFTSKKTPILIDCHNTHVASVGNEDKLITAVGLDNLAIINTPDAMLVTDRHNCQKVRNLIEQLKDGENNKYTEFPSTVIRPWGSYSTLMNEEGCRTKQIIVASGQKLSLQFHNKREEHWVVTKGRALVQVGNQSFDVGPGEYTHIPVGEKHRLSNNGDEELVLVEIQMGSYLEEDDIVRLDDIYGRLGA